MANSLQKRIALQYYRWELTTAIYMLEPWEKVIVNLLFTALFALIVYAGIAYLPNTIMSSVGRIASYTSDI